MSRSLVVNLLVVALGVVVVATVVGLVVLWPSTRSFEAPGVLTRPQTERAEVVLVAETPCPAPGQTDCRRVDVRLRSGPDEGERVSLTVLESEQALPLSVGDAVRVSENPVPEGAQVGGVAVQRYTLADFERRAPLAWLAVLFAVLVVATGRGQGLRALAGLALSLGIVLGFIVPALLDGQSPSGVALTGALAIMLVTLGITHGPGVKTLAASLGTASALVLTLLLAELFSDLAHLTGLSSDEAVFLRAVTGDISIQGLFLAGVVIGALGVLDDLTVTQASTVLALKRADPRLGFGGLFRGALAVGHDHIAATVNTLVLAYAGASLPVLLIFGLGGTSLGDAVNSESVAEEIVATLVGSIGLIAAVPVTTALAAILASRVAPARLTDAHGHGH